MASANVNLGIDEMEELPLQSVVRRREPAVTKRYEAMDLLPGDKSPLDDLLHKQPAVLGSVQVVSGLLSVGIGILFASTQKIGNSLFCLFRVSHMTGALFVIAGFISNMLFKYPELLSACFMINCGCLCVAFAAAPLIIVDLTRWNPYDEFLRMEMLELCLLGLQSCLSAILCFWFVKEKRKGSP